ncbi:hypothetical protein RB594_003010 [Gaeumannomyces avenae]
MFRFFVPPHQPNHDGHRPSRSENPTPNDDNKEQRPDDMADEVYKRVGRGGAGNFYSKRDVEDAAKASKASTDLEAQKTASSLAQPPAASGGSAPYSRAGRGGAGNFYDGGDAADSAERSAEARKAHALVGASLAQLRSGGLGGRGGAGNWSDSNGGDGGAVPPWERPTMDQLQAKIVKDVDAGLAPPPKTYHQSERDVE